MFPTIPDGFFETLFVLAAIGVISALGGIGYGLYWLVTHVRFV
jgi:hypothetical protein